MEVSLPVRYKDILLDCGYRIDLVVGGTLIVETKCVETLLPIHQAQILTYMRLSKFQSDCSSISTLRNYKAALSDSSFRVCCVIFVSFVVRLSLVFQ